MCLYWFTLVKPKCVLMPTDNLRLFWFPLYQDLHVKLPRHSVIMVHPTVWEVPQNRLPRLIVKMLTIRDGVIFEVDFLKCLSWIL